ncbi:MAG: glycosyltransferase, partial [Candidatus Sumerlaeia bacterium]|nr:glycosyltransferase [Candidatus Sumerlaeia bacterium]
LMELNFPRDRLEIVVVDNASTDRTPEIIKSFPVKYVYESKRNRARARNTAVSASNGDVVAFTDADCIVDKEWLNYLVPHFYGNELI